MKNVKLFLKSFITTFFILTAVASLFTFYYVRNTSEPVVLSNKTKKTDAKKLPDYRFLITISGQDKAFYFVNLRSENKEIEVINLPKNLKLHNQSQIKSLQFFYDYGGCEYLYNVLSEFWEIDCFFEFSGDDLSALADDFGGFSIKLPIKDEGRQIFNGDDFPFIYKYLTGLTKEGERFARSEIAGDIITEILLKKYQMSFDDAFKLILNHSKSNISAIYTDELRESVGYIKLSASDAKIIYLKGTFGVDIYSQIEFVLEENQ